MNPSTQAHASTPIATPSSPAPFPQQATHIVIHQPVKNHKGLARAAWILIFLVCGVALLPFLGFASWLVAGPVFFVTFILSIMVMARGGTLPGILLLLTSIIIGPIFVACAPFVSSLLGLVPIGSSLQNSKRPPNVAIDHDSIARTLATDSKARRLDDHHTLISIQPLPPGPEDAAVLQFDWELRAQRDTILWVDLYLRDEKGRLIRIIKGPIAPKIEAGRTTERWAVRAPATAKPGEYQALVVIYDPSDTNRTPDTQHFKRVVFDVGKFLLR